MNQDKFCAECKGFYKLDELIEGLFCPRCQVFSNHVWEQLEEHVNKNGPIIFKEKF